MFEDIPTTLATKGSGETQEDNSPFGGISTVPTRAPKKTIKVRERNEVLFPETMNVDGEAWSRKGAEGIILSYMNKRKDICLWRIINEKTVHTGAGSKQKYSRRRIGEGILFKPPYWRARCADCGADEELSRHRDTHHHLLSEEIIDTVLFRKNQEPDWAEEKAELQKRGYVIGRENRSQLEMIKWKMNYCEGNLLHYKDDIKPGYYKAEIEYLSCAELKRRLKLHPREWKKEYEALLDKGGK